ncbi:hypothetical protein BMG523Draft_00562, partial [Frankia sp. BMG5.23]
METVRNSDWTGDLDRSCDRDSGGSERDSGGSER